MRTTRKASIILTLLVICIYLVPVVYSQTNVTPPGNSVTGSKNTDIKTGSTSYIKPVQKQWVASVKPTWKPTIKPTATPKPTWKPTIKPTATPKPTWKPTIKPTATPKPTYKPTVTPTIKPDKGGVKGIKFYDSNRDGIYQPGEKVIKDVTIKLFNASGSLISQTMTNKNGYYQFTNLLPGKYTVCETVPAGYINTTPACVDFYVYSGKITSVCFGNILIENGSINGTKFLDRNRDGKRDPGDPGVPYVTIQLYKDGVFLKGMVTDLNGNFEFSNLHPGDYTVKEVLLPIDEPTTPIMVNVTVESNKTVTVLFGNAPVQKGSIQGIKFDDINQTGTYEPGDPGVPGVTIQLFNNSNLIAQTMTNESGFFKFTNLHLGTYIVHEVVPPERMTTSPQNVTAEVTANNITMVYFGNIIVPPYMAGNITGAKYNDTNRNGIYEPGVDMPVQGVTIHLMQDGMSLEQVVTDANGQFEFLNLHPGTYVVHETLPMGRINTTPTSVTVEVTSGNTSNVIFLNAPILPKEEGIIRGIKFNDSNRNGIYDPAVDAGISGVTINLFLDNVLEGSTVTNATGYYEFTGLAPGTYVVQEVLPSGRFDTTPINVTVSVTHGDIKTVNFGNSPQYKGPGGTIGFWRNPNGQQAIVDLNLLPIQLGNGTGKTVTVSTLAEANDYLNRQGDSSNGINRLYAQMLATKLNIKSGYAANSTVLTAIQEADDFLALYNETDWVALNGMQQMQVNIWKDIFDVFNNYVEYLKNDP